MPLFSITALALSTVDPFHLLDRPPAEQAVGAALFAAHVAHGVVRFDLRSIMLEQTDFAGDLIGWIDQHLPHAGVLSGYDVAGRLLPALARLPGAADSPALAALSGEVPKVLIDLRGLDADQRVLPLADACAPLGIPASRRDRDTRFIDYIFSRSDAAEHALQLDAIATLRLTFHQMAERTRLGERVEAEIMPALELWLEASELPAAQMHRL